MHCALGMCTFCNDQHLGQHCPKRALHYCVSPYACYLDASLRTLPKGSSARPRKAQGASLTSSAKPQSSRHNAPSPTLNPPRQRLLLVLVVPLVLVLITAAAVTCHRLLAGLKGPSVPAACTAAGQPLLHTVRPIRQHQQQWAWQVMLCRLSHPGCHTCHRPWQVLAAAAVAASACNTAARRAATPAAAVRKACMLCCLACT